MTPAARALGVRKRTPRFPESRSGSAALAPARLSQHPHFCESQMEQPTLASRSWGEPTIPLLGAGQARARPSVRVQTLRCTRAPRDAGAGRGLPEQVATPGSLTTGQSSSRERSRPQDHSVHSPPTSPIHPHLPQDQRALARGPPCPRSPSPRHVADQVCSARVPLSSWRGGSRPGSATPATPSFGNLGARWRGRGC